MGMTEFPFYDEAGIGRQVDEKVVLAKLKTTERDFSKKELSFIRSCRFYWHTDIQTEIVRIAERRNIGSPY